MILVLIFAEVLGLYGLIGEFFLNCINLMDNAHCSGSYSQYKGPSFRVLTRQRDAASECSRQ